VGEKRRETSGFRVYTKGAGGIRKGEKCWGAWGLTGDSVEKMWGRIVV